MKSALPKHIGFIPDGNRRWAVNRGLAKEHGYAFGIEPGIALLKACKQWGIEEISIYGFTQDNTKRPSEQKKAFAEACVMYACEAAKNGAALLVVGDTQSAQFPEPLKAFSSQRLDGDIKVNLLVNYGWEWDLAGMKSGHWRSHHIPRLDLIIRWGGGRRLSGFLPVQSVYADFYVVDALWPDFLPAHFESALQWYRQQDRTLGG